ncbi:MAG: VWA domain-containing protein [Candidatus Nanoarchaeia archaeon]|nr:VWA domain-containing protein [Candidatus Nanoarchaeia archaeon]
MVEKDLEMINFFENKKNNFKFPIILIIILIALTLKVNAESEGFCGGDIVLVLDSSGSINSSEMAIMKSAAIGFVEHFLPDTDSEIAVVDFDEKARLVQDFTTDLNKLKSKINYDILSGGYTNWEDALRISGEQFPNRLGNPDLIIFASDGMPNRIGYDPVLGVGESEAVAAAVERAKELNDSGVRIIALGIGIPSSKVANMKEISSDISGNEEDYIDAKDFDDFTEKLAELAKKLCTAVVRGVVTDDSGNPIPGATVQVIGVKDPNNPDYTFTTITDENGEYIIENVMPGKHDIVVYKTGYQELNKNFTFYVDMGITDFPINFIIFKGVEECQQDCSKKSDVIPRCNPECDGINGCKFYSEYEGDKRAKDACTTPYKKVAGVVESFNSTHKIICCGTFNQHPYIQKKNMVVKIPDNATNVVTITRLVFWRGRILRMVTHVWN